MGKTCERMDNKMSKELNIDWSVKASRAGFLVDLTQKFGYKSYLEIGCRDNRTFDKINCPKKVGVDPARGGTIRTTSDEFFKSNTDTFDLIFIDGDHRSEQVLRDVLNATKCLNAGGTIVMHDCIPLKEEHQFREYKGGICNQDAWKACMVLRMQPEIDVAVGLFDCGVGVIKLRDNSDKLTLDFELTQDNMLDVLTWDMFANNWEKWLRVFEYDQLMMWVQGR